jgi:hypothetical protein
MLRSNAEARSNSPLRLRDGDVPRAHDGRAPDERGALLFHARRFHDAWQLHGDVWLLPRDVSPHDHGVRQLFPRVT